MLNNASNKRGENQNKLEGIGENTSRMLGGSDPQIWVEDGVDQGGIWCEGEEGREKVSSLFLRSAAARERLGMGGLGPRVV